MGWDRAAQWCGFAATARGCASRARSSADASPRFEQRGCGGVAALVAVPGAAQGSEDDAFEAGAAAAAAAGLGAGAQQRQDGECGARADKNDQEVPLGEVLEL
jgi:hypothetical protein